VKKIPTLFLRDPEDRKHVTRDVNPECQWVMDGEGIPTRKWDGTCTMLDENGRWWARREVKPGKVAPPFFQLLETDKGTGKTYGWEPMEQSSFAKFHAEAVERSEWAVDPGTYELVGPSINGNPERFEEHILIRHGGVILNNVPRTYDGIRERLNLNDEMEGIVFWHPDGRRAKIKRRDFPQEDR